MENIKEYYENLYRKHDILLDNIKNNLPELKTMLEKAINLSEDDVYRYYHHSFKVYCINDLTKEILVILKKISPNENKDDLNKFFKEIWEDASKYSEFESNHNSRWSIINRAKLEAFFHAKYFLEQAIRFSKLDNAPESLPSGWAALLYLYNIR